MGRLQKLTDVGSATDIVSNATYNPAGQLLTTSSGTYVGVSETRAYNSLGQMTQLTTCNNGYTCSVTQNIQYNYPATQNNGKITSQNDLLSGEQVSYAYDSLNHLASASGSGWGQSYTYGRRKPGQRPLTHQNDVLKSSPRAHHKSTT